MDDGVKHRLSNVIAWAGFMPGMLMLLSPALWFALVLQPYTAEQELITAYYSKRDEFNRTVDLSLENMREFVSANGRADDWDLRADESKNRLTKGNDIALLVALCPPRFGHY